MRVPPARPGRRRSLVRLGGGGAVDRPVVVVVWAACPTRRRRPPGLTTTNAITATSTAATTSAIRWFLDILCAPFRRGAPGGRARTTSTDAEREGRDPRGGARARHGRARSGGRRTAPRPERTRGRARRAPGAPAATRRGRRRCSTSAASGAERRAPAAARDQPPSANGTAGPRSAPGRERRLEQLLSAVDGEQHDGEREPEAEEARRSLAAGGRAGPVEGHEQLGARRGRAAGRPRRRRAGGRRGRGRRSASPAWSPKPIR